jgi:hypothetical protein
MNNFPLNVKSVMNLDILLGIAHKINKIKKFGENKKRRDGNR